MKHDAAPRLNDGARLFTRTLHIGIMILLEFFKKPHTAGAIAASGTELSRLITDLAELSGAHTIVEFGPGTGVFTREIEKKKNADALFISIENDADFIPRLQKEFPDVAFHLGSAEHMRKYLKEHSRSSCDRIISGLPWSIFNESLQRNIIHAVHESLTPGGLFLTFSYIHSQYFPGGVGFRKLIFKTFSSVTKSRIVWKNLPPAFIYICKK